MKSLWSQHNVNYVVTIFIMNTKNTPVINQTIIDDFLTSKKISGWSDSMIKRTKRRLATFCVDFSDDSQIIQDGFEGWRNQLAERNLSVRTINEYISAAVQFVEHTGIAEVRGYNKRELDLSGQEFGNLKVLQKAGGRKTTERSFLWECQCSCGNIVEIPTDQLMKGFHTSCGCQKVKRLREINQYVDGTSLRMVFSDTIRSDNTTGHKGIYIKGGRFAARIQYKGKRYYLGTFDKIEDAVSVREEAEEKIREACAEVLCENTVKDTNNI